MYSQDELLTLISGCHCVVSGLPVIKTLFAAGSCVENAACAANVVLGRNVELEKFSLHLTVFSAVPSHNTPRGA